ncbi:MAG TPA: hypothetical protein DCE81_05710, partial [Cytophagales bacterium]|nr:hypothetical protein [Cytophagales bacterium]
MSPQNSGFMEIKVRDIHQPELLDFKRVGSSALGYISIAEKLPFQIRRVYWTYYAPHEVIRGHHAHKALRQVIFAVSGVIKFNLENIQGVKKFFILDRPEMGLYITNFHWRTM